MDEMYKEFWKEEVEPRLSDKLLALEEYFQKNGQELFKKTAIKLENVLADCVSLQQRDRMKAIGYLVPTLLRTSLLEKNYSYTIFAYDKWLYLKDGIPVGELPADWIFQGYEELRSELLKKESYYFGKIREPQIEVIHSKTALYFQDYMTQLLRGSMKYFVKEDTFSKIAMEEELVLATGELWEKLSMVYKTRAVPYDVFDLRFDIDEKQDMEFACFRKFPLKQVDFSGMMLGYADFTDSQLSDTDFSNSNLQGTRFVNCQLKNSQFIHAKLCEADFTNANLEGANLVGAYANVGLEKEDSWNGAGKLPIHFDGANLRNADLSNSYFFGVDFRKADITGASWKGAVLTKCLFTEEQEVLIRSSEAKLEGVVS